VVVSQQPTICWSEYVVRLYRHSLNLPSQLHRKFKSVFKTFSRKPWSWPRSSPKTNTVLTCWCMGTSWSIFRVHISAVVSFQRMRIASSVRTSSSGFALISSWCWYVFLCFGRKNEFKRVIFILSQQETFSVQRNLCISRQWFFPEFFEHFADENFWNWIITVLLGSKSSTRQILVTKCLKSYDVKENIANHYDFALCKMLFKKYYRFVGKSSVNSPSFS